MGHLRLLILLFIAWLVLALNIERPDAILNLGQISITPNIYAITAITVGTVLLVPKLSKSYILLQIIVLMIVYWVSKLLLKTDGLDVIIRDYVTYVEIAIVLLTFWITRELSGVIINFREEIDRAVLSSAKLGIQTFVYDDGNAQHGTTDLADLETRAGLSNEQAISEELRRARRYNRTFSLFAVQIVALPKQRVWLSSYWNRRTMLENLYLRTYIVQLLQDLLLDESDIVVWHQDYLLIGLPETDHDAATTFVQNLKQAFEVLMDTSPQIGFAIFPDDALVYSDLLEVAMDSLDPAPATLSDPAEKTTGSASASQTLRT